MAGLRQAKIVRSERGHRGGWFLGRDIASITVRDVCQALGEPVTFSLRHRGENPECIVEKAMNKALVCAFSDAQSLLIDRLGAISLADPSREFRLNVAALDAEVKICSDAV